MRFTKLRLVGFKSFVDATELPIEPGLTGVVGPNGCGKSNLLEALRWVMGESSAKRMRGAEMDDVIFGGTAGRPARNVAEVTLTLDNSARTAPAGFNDADELEVLRRIERGTGSDYRINGRSVRARDVQILFADNASGASSPALVSQGRVGALINAKPSERRAILEEAAGIGGLHARRSEAEQRLRAAEQNLSRLDDVARELDAQIRALRTQARQATRYRNLSEQIRRAEARLFHQRWRAAEADLIAARQRFQDADGVVADRMLAVAAATRGQADAAAILPDRRRRDAEAAAELQRLLVAREALASEERRVADALTAARQRLAQAEEDMRRERSLATDAAEALARIESETARLREAQAAEGPALDAARTALDAVRQEVEALDAELSRRTAELAAAETHAQGLKRQDDDLAARAQTLERRLNEARAQRAAAERDAVAPDVLAAAEAAVADAAAALEAAQAESDTAGRAKQEAEQRLAAVRETVHAADAALGRLRAEESALAALLRAQSPSGGTPALDLVSVRPGCELALAAAFGDDLTLPVGGDTPSRWEHRPGRGDAALPDGATPLGDVVTAPTELARRLAATGLVADEATGRRLAAELATGQMLVTAAGAAWRWDGVTVAAGAPSAAAVRLQQRNRLDALRGDIEAAQAKASQAAAVLTEARGAVDAAAARERAARDAVRAAIAAANIARDRHAALNRTAAAAGSRLATAAEALARLEADMADLAAQRTRVAEERAALPDLSRARQDLAEKRADLNARRAAQAEAQARIERLQREQGGRRHRLEALATEERTWRTRAAGAGGRLDELTARARAAHAEIESLAGRPAQIAAERDALLDRSAEAEAVRRRAADALAQAEAAQTEADRALRQAEAGLAEARESRARAEGAVAAAQQAVDAAAARIEERFDLAPDRLVAAVGLEPTETEPDPGLDDRLMRLMRERESMGPVNLRADQELAEVETRLDVLTRERADLEAAIARLRQGIGSLNREARERLTAAFDTVDGHFQRLFVQLFGGGRAQLRLTDADDPLDAGLEIFASPPGKRLQILSLLSGGEQALTALALIFAVFLTNPAPVCVLDEVDAPLDEANVDRFCSMVESIAQSARTRFLIVTHHRLTMARMDRLFGVTMMEPGVSRLVSVDLREAEAMRATA